MSKRGLSSTEADGPRRSRRLATVKPLLDSDEEGGGDQQFVQLGGQQPGAAASNTSASAVNAADNNSNVNNQPPATAPKGGRKAPAAKKPAAAKKPPAAKKPTKKETAAAAAAAQQYYQPPKPPTPPRLGYTGHNNPKYKRIADSEIPHTLTLYPAPWCQDGTSLPPSIDDLLQQFGMINVTDKNVSNFQLPSPSTTTTTTSEENKPAVAPDDPSYRCAICFGPYAIGDDVFTAPCFHRYHFDCISMWLNSLQEKKDEVETSTLLGTIQSYREQVAEWNRLFDVRQFTEIRYEQDPNTKSLRSYQTHTWRQPNTQEINAFREPPRQPAFSRETKLTIQVECPDCRCDWGKEYLGLLAYGDDDY